MNYQNKSYKVDIKQITALTEDKKLLISLNTEKINIIQKLNNFPKLKTFAKVWRGLTTGDDGKYISENKENNNYKPLITGAEIQRYMPLTNKKFVAYLPKELDRARDEAIFLLPEKLLSKFVGNRLTFTYDNQQFYVLNSGCVTQVIDNNINIKFLLGLLNSHLLDFYFSNIFTDYRETFPIMKSGNIEELPIFLGETDQQNEIIVIVTQILSIKQQNTSADTAELDAKIDQLVYQLYGLSEAEIAIIEGKK